MNIRFFLTLMICLFPILNTQINAAVDVQDSNSLKSSPAKDLKPDIILQKVSKASSEIKTLQSDISYLTIQDPDIVNSEILQTGKLYYQRGKDSSRLRIRFDTLQQDDFPAEESVEDYYFDGVWLTKVDYKLEQVNRYQQAPENEPVEVFELINNRFPLFGLSKTDNLQQDFSITIVDHSVADPNEPFHLLLETKKDSKYRDDYKKLDIWIDKSLYLPRRIVAYSIQGDIYDIRFFHLLINKKLKNGVFTIETPSGFRQNVETLETTQQRKG